MDILNEAKKIHKILVELRRDFHLHPELSMKEYRTATRIEEELDKLGIEHYRSTETGVIGLIRGTGESIQGIKTAPEKVKTEWWRFERI